jgi:hypothetical protein
VSFQEITLHTINLSGYLTLLYHKLLQILAYADDIDIIGRTERAVREASENFERTARQMGLRVNEGKTEYMEVTTRPTNQKVLKVKNYEFECVNEFKYLGTLVTNNNRITAGKKKS